MEARLGSCDTREFIMVLARELADGGEADGKGGVGRGEMGELWCQG
jgi:hypothetical protein